VTHRGNPKSGLGETDCAGLDEAIGRLLAGCRCGQQKVQYRQPWHVHCWATRAGPAVAGGFSSPSGVGLLCPRRVTPAPGACFIGRDIRHQAERPKSKRRAPVCLV